MSNKEVIELVGASGSQYSYTIYPASTSFAAKLGNYAFAKRHLNGKYELLYFGETQDFSERFSGHHALPCAERRGMSHIMAHTNNGGVSGRRDEEQDLISAYDPPCNG